MDKNDYVLELKRGLKDVKSEVVECTATYSDANSLFKR